MGNGTSPVSAGFPRSDVKLSLAPKAPEIKESLAVRFTLWNDGKRQNEKSPARGRGRAIGMGSGGNPENSRLADRTQAGIA